MKQPWIEVTHKNAQNKGIKDDSLMKQYYKDITPLNSLTKRKQPKLAQQQSDADCYLSRFYNLDSHVICDNYDPEDFYPIYGLRGK